MPKDALTMPYNVVKHALNMSTYLETVFLRNQQTVMTCYENQSVFAAFPLGAHILDWIHENALIL